MREYPWSVHMAHERDRQSDRPADGSTSRATHGGVIDARGRRVRCLDPVRVKLLGGRPPIADDDLEEIVGELLPTARRERRVIVVSSILCIGLVGGGTAGWAVLRGGWPPLDPVLLGIHLLQAAFIVGGPVLSWWMVRQRYARRIVDVMLRHRCCPHCGYGLQGLEPDAQDGATTCPECGCAWRVGVASAAA